MLTVERQLHFTHAVANNEKRPEVEKFYLDVFAAQTYFDARPVQGLERDETLVLIGRTSFIPIAPYGEPSEVGNVIAGYGGRWMGVALKVPDIHAADAHMKSKGLHPIYFDPIYHSIFFFTNSEETCHIPFEFCQIDMPNDLRVRSEWSPDWWRDSHPLGIEKCASLVTATDDLDKTKKFYREVFELEQIGEREVEAERARSAAFWMGDFVFEVMQPTGSGTPLADFVSRYKGGVYSVNFKTRSMATAVGFLKSKGLRLLGDTNKRVTIDPDDAYGARFVITSEDVPGDPRK